MPKKKEISLESLLKDGLIRKGDDPFFAYDRIQFGIPVLDLLIGGGIPTKRFTLITGQSGAGKSYLASQVAKNVMEAGGTAAWIDSEWSWDESWMNKCGVDTSKIIVSQPESGEQAFDIMKALMQNKINVVILDSIAGLFPSDMSDQDFSYNPMAWQARMVNQAFPRLLPNLKYGSAVVLINQIRSSMGPVALDAMPGGLGQTFFSHLLLQVRRSGWIEEDEKKVGFDIEIRQRKSKVGGASYQSCVVPFRLAGGIDMVETFIREFIDKGHIIQSKAWYQIGNDEKVIGMNNVKKFFVENPNKFDEYKKKLTNAS